MTPGVRMGIVVGGAIGTLLRWALSHLPDVAGMPIGTFVANVGGALVLGALVGTLRTPSSEGRWTPVTAGMLGATTTFSTFVHEVVTLWAGAPVATATYLVVTVAVGLGAVALGRRLFAGAHT